MGFHSKFFFELKVRVGYQSLLSSMTATPLDQHGTNLALGYLGLVEKFRILVKF